MFIGFRPEEITEAIRLSKGKSAISFGMIPQEYRKELRKIKSNRRPRMIKRGFKANGSILTIFVFENGFKAYYDDMRIFFPKKN